MERASKVKKKTRDDCYNYTFLFHVVIAGISKKTDAKYFPIDSEEYTNTSFNNELL